MKKVKKTLPVSIALHADKFTFQEIHRLNAEIKCNIYFTLLELRTHIEIYFCTSHKILAIIKAIILTTGASLSKNNPLAVNESSLHS